jgi:hypothetical protein
MDIYLSQELQLQARYQLLLLRSAAAFPFRHWTVPIFFMCDKSLTCENTLRFMIRIARLENRLSGFDRSLHLSGIGFLRSIGLTAIRLLGQDLISLFLLLGLIGSSRVMDNLEEREEEYLYDVIFVCRSCVVCWRI